VNKLRPADMEDNLIEALEMIAPGTQLRQAIDNIVRARTGALLVFAEEDSVQPLISGGIAIDVALKPMILYELAKMDGAILLDRTGSHIFHANVQLMPDASIESQETGTRHRTAERVAKQLGASCISISAARDVVTVYVGGIRYIMDPIRIILSKADQALQTLERFKSRLTQVTTALTVLEFQDNVTLFDVTSVLQRTEMVLALSHLIERYIIELGTEGRLVSLQLQEMLLNVREDREDVLAEYVADPTPERVEQVRDALISLPSEQLISMSSIGAILGYPQDDNSLETHLHPSGYRVLRKIPRLNREAVEAVLRRFTSLQAIVDAPLADLAAVSGVGSLRARDIKEGLARLREMNMLERYG
jgi:diadenylate cyclase